MKTVAFKRLKMKKVTDGADADEKFVTYEVTYKVRIGLIRDLGGGLGWLRQIGRMVASTITLTCVVLSNNAVDPRGDA